MVGLPFTQNHITSRIVYGHNNSLSWTNEQQQQQQHHKQLTSCIIFTDSSSTQAFLSFSRHKTFFLLVIILIKVKSSTKIKWFIKNVCSVGREAWKDDDSSLKRAYVYCTRMLFFCLLMVRADKTLKIMGKWMRGEEKNVLISF